MTHRALFQNLHHRPGMLGLDGSFGQYTAFLHGYSRADGDALDGWREWLVTQFDDGNNVGWPALVIWLGLPPKRPPVRPLTAEEDRAASEALFRLLDQFLTARERNGGAAAVKADHQAWMERQDWYRSDSAP